MRAPCSFSKLRLLERPIRGAGFAVWGLLSRSPAENMAPAWLMVVVLACLATAANAVDRAKFRTCRDTGFCRRHRAPAPPPPTFSVLRDSVTVSGLHGLSALLQDESFETPPLKMNLRFYDNGVARLQVPPLAYRTHAPRFALPAGTLLNLRTCGHGGGPAGSVILPCRAAVPRARACGWPSPLTRPGVATLFVG